MQHSTSLCYECKESILFKLKVEKLKMENVIYPLGKRAVMIFRDKFMEKNGRFHGNFERQIPGEMISRNQLISQEFSGQILLESVG